jgi:hypothetical protein
MMLRFIDNFSNYHNLKGILMCKMIRCLFVVGIALAFTPSLVWTQDQVEPVVSEEPADLMTPALTLYLPLVQSGAEGQMDQASADTVNAAAVGVTYFVSTTGNDANDGLAVARAFRTIQRAADLTNPGDTVCVMGGVYADDSREKFVYLQIARSGQPGAYIRYRTCLGQTVRLQSSNAWILVQIAASYIQFEGFELMGNNDSLTYEYAYSRRNDAIPETNGAGLWIGGVDSAAPTPHHVEVRKNKIFKWPAAGIHTGFADYITIEDNVVHSNAWYSRYADSGIAIWYQRDVDTFTGYKNFIRRNIVYNNESYIPWKDSGQISDGNGIIVDLNQSNNYQGRTLIANNLVVNNGGTGIHTYRSAHVDIYNNTAYLNAHSPALNYCTICATASHDIQIRNNIIYARTGKPSNKADTRNSAVFYDYNLYFGGLVPQELGLNDQITNPRFINANIDLAVANFRLATYSPARNAGDCVTAVSPALGNKQRPQTQCDIGAYEQ